LFTTYFELADSGFITCFLEEEIILTN